MTGKNDWHKHVEIMSCELAGYSKLKSHEKRKVKSRLNDLVMACVPEGADALGDLFLDVHVGDRIHRTPLVAFDGRNVTIDLPPPSVVVVELEGTDRADYRVRLEPTDPRARRAEFSLFENGQGIGIVEPGSYELELVRTGRGSSPPQVIQMIELRTGVQTLTFRVD